MEDSFEDNIKLFWAMVKRMDGRGGKSGTGVVRDKNGKIMMPLIPHQNVVCEAVTSVNRHAHGPSSE